MIASPVNEENIEKVKRLAKYATVKHIEKDPLMHFVVVDAEQCMLIHRVPNDEYPVRGEDVSIWTNDQAIVGAMREIALDFTLKGIDYESFNIVKSSLVSISNWLSAIGIETETFLEILGKEVGAYISGILKSKKIESLIEELDTFWQSHNLGRIKVVEKKPLTFTMENYMDCSRNPKIASGLCKFITAMLNTIALARLATRYEIEHSECPEEGKTLCRFVIKKAT